MIERTKVGDQVKPSTFNIFYEIFGDLDVVSEELLLCTLRVFLLYCEAGD